MLPKKTLKVAESRRSLATVEVEIDAAGELHMTGTITGPRGEYSGGQVQDHVEADAARIAAEPDGVRHMPAHDLAAFVSIWRAWHLNHMRAGCEHQRAVWDISERLNVAGSSKAAGWVLESEHPRGLLCKPCPTCGYKYGSAWLKETLPADVVAAVQRIAGANA